MPYCSDTLLKHFQNLCYSLMKHSFCSLYEDNELADQIIEPFSGIAVSGTYFFHVIDTSSSLQIIVSFDCRRCICYVKRISNLWIPTSFVWLVSMSSVIADVDAFDNAIISELEKPSDEQDDMAHDSIISELEKPSDDQDDMAHGSEPLRKKTKSDLEVAAPKTPEI